MFANLLTALKPMNETKMLLLDKEELIRQRVALKQAIKERQLCDTHIVFFNTRIETLTTDIEKQEQSLKQKYSYNAI